MSIFHRHHWRQTASEWTPPQNRSIEARGFGTEELIERLVLGYTTASLVCIGCGEPTTRILPGRHSTKPAASHLAPVTDAQP